jgi:hypothetical protein
VRAVSIVSVVGPSVTASSTRCGNGKIAVVSAPAAFRVRVWQITSR